MLDGKVIPLWALRIVSFFEIHKGNIMFKKILVPVDLSTETTTEKLCQAANDLANQYDADIQLSTVMPGFGMPLVASYFPEDAQQKVKAEMKDKLEALASQYFEKNVSTKLLQGKRAQSILTEIGSSSPDLVMLGCRRKKSRSSQHLMGSTTKAISDRADCSVLIVR